MRRLAALFLLFLLPACYQAEGDVVQTGASVRVDGFKDGRYLRPDGVEIRVAWNEAEKLYDVIAAGSDKGRAGTARAARMGGGLYLIQYMDAARVTVLAKLDGEAVVLQAPTKEAEARLLKAHGLGLRPSPINGIIGSAGSVRNFFKDLAASGEFAEVARMIPVK